MKRIPERLLPDLVTIKRPVQSKVAGTLKPVFKHEVVATGVRARFDPVSVALQTGVVGRVPKRVFRLFLNLTELKENYQVVRESDGKVFHVAEVLDYRSHHMEATIEERPT